MRPKVYIARRANFPLWNIVVMYAMTGGQMGNCPTAAFVYIHRNQSSNRSTVNKELIGKNKEPGR